MIAWKKLSGSGVGGTGRQRVGLGNGRVTKAQGNKDDGKEEDLQEPSRNSGKVKKKVIREEQIDEMAPETS